MMKQVEGRAGEKEEKVDGTTEHILKLQEKLVALQEEAVAFPTAQEKFYVKKNGGEKAEDLTTPTSPAYQQSDCLYRISPLQHVAGDEPWSTESPWHPFGS